MHQADLKFYPENPRIYSIVHGSTEALNQQEIENRLKKFEHVKKLVQSIKSHGGLINPLIVRDGDNVVLEGNSRLAAYRILAHSDPIKWGHVKCVLLPSDIQDDLVFALLGQYHIIGQKNWAPFEQAGYLWRRCNQHGIPADKIGKEMGIGVKTIKHLVNIYQFMVDHHEEDPERWSYYEEYLRPRKVQKQREEHPELDKIVVAKIKSGEIPKAVDVRDKVVKVIASGGKTLRKFIDKKESLEECYESAVASGANNLVLKKIEKFKEMILDPDMKDDILEMPGNQQKKCRYALLKINKSIEQILKKLDNLIGP
ncbi:MAG TPA: hypothetical protein DE117_06785 [Fervidobacterium sp.]|nr:hypothetical protein [Fervidobacterium sp.]